MSEQLLRLAQVSSKVGLHKTAIYARIATGKFPAPVKDGQLSRWLESEVDAYIEQLRLARDGDQNGDRQAA